MKTMVSIDADTFSDAERYSQICGIPRSELYGLTYSKGICATHTPNLVTERLDQFYRSEQDETDEFVRQAARNLFAKEDW